MPIINLKMFKEGDIIRQDDFNSPIQALKGSEDSSSPGLYGSESNTVDGVDQENFREGGLDRRAIFYGGIDDDSIFTPLQSTSQTTADQFLTRNNDTDWRFVSGPNISGDTTKPNFAGIKIDWNPERDQYVIIRCSAYLDSVGQQKPPATGSDMWDLGLFIIPPGFGEDYPLPKRTNPISVRDSHDPIVWPYQRVCLADSYSRSLGWFENLLGGLSAEEDGNDFHRGTYFRDSRWNSSFQLNYVARSGQSTTQSGISPPTGTFHSPPRWKERGTAYAFLVYRNAVPDIDVSDLPVSMGGPFAESVSSPALKAMNMNYTVYRR